MLPTRSQPERTPGDDAAIEVRGLTKRFGERVAVDGVDLAVPAGRAFGLLGHNGAGKTTLIRMLLGLTRPDAGEMSLLGHPLPAERAAALARVGAVVEAPVFYDHLSGRENLWTAAAVRGPAVRDRIPVVLARVGLRERADDKVKAYSTGMRQRLGLARCLLADPPLLILDEPTNGLDPAGMLAFRTLVRELVEVEGRTVFISSHLLDEVEKMCDAAAIVDRGRVIAHGAIADLLDAAGSDLLIGCDDPTRALSVVRAQLGLDRGEPAPGGLRVPISGPFPGGMPTPSAGLVVRAVAWVALANGVVCVVAVGLGALTGSRPAALIGLIAWQTIASRLLIDTTALGGWRRAVLDAALGQLKPGPHGDRSVAMPALMAAAIVAGWVIVAGAAAAWRTAARDA